MIRPVICFDWITKPYPPVEATDEPMETDEPSSCEVVADIQFACPRCALSGVDGNTLARHLVEDCGVEGATLQPDPEIVSARLQAEAEMRLQEEQQQEQNAAAEGYTTGVDSTTAGLHDPTAESIVADSAAISGVPMAIEQQAVTLGTAGNLPSTIDITDAGGEVVQRLVLPEDLQLEPGQTLVLIQGEDGQPQLAVINQAGKEKLSSILF